MRQWLIMLGTPALAMSLAILFAQCKPIVPVTSADARAAYCSDAAVIALDESCRAAIKAAKPAQRSAVANACFTLIDVQALTCGDAP